MLIMSPLFGGSPFLLYGVDVGILTVFSRTRLNILLVGEGLMLAKASLELTTYLKMTLNL